MGLGHSELFRNLPAAIDFRAHRIENDRIFIEDRDRVIQIRFSTEKVRHLGALHLPLIQLEFFFDHSSQEIDAFMNRFDLYFRRGGG